MKDLEPVRDRRLKEQVRETIGRIEEAGSLQEIADIKRLRGGERYYRMKIGDYRLGMVLQGDRVIFVRFLHRKDVYRYLP